MPRLGPNDLTIRCQFTLQTPEAAKITVKLTPGAKRDEIQGWEEDLFGEKTLKLSVTAIPEKGKANKAMIALLAKHFGQPKSAFTLVRGHKTRVKIIEVQGLKDLPS